MTQVISDGLWFRKCNQVSARVPKRGWKLGLDALPCVPQPASGFHSAFTGQHSFDLTKEARSYSALMKALIESKRFGFSDVHKWIFLHIFLFLGDDPYQIFCLLARPDAQLLYCHIHVNIVWNSVGSLVACTKGQGGSTRWPVLVLTGWVDAESLLNAQYHTINIITIRLLLCRQCTIDLERLATWITVTVVWQNRWKCAKSGDSL